MQWCWLTSSQMQDELGAIGWKEQRGCARAAERVFKYMWADVVCSRCRISQGSTNFSTFSGVKDSSRAVDMMGLGGYRQWGIGHKFESKHRLRHLVFPQAEPVVVPFEEGRDGGGADFRDRINKVPPCFRRRRQVWKLNPEVGQMLFSGAPERGHILVADFLEWSTIT